jgi:hypothetical protein
MPDEEAVPLSEVLAGRAFACPPMEFDFIGGPNDGKTEDVPSWMLSVHLGGHRYRMAIAKSSDPNVPFKYVLVSHTLLETP